MKIGMVGTGIMGNALAKRLLGLGYEVLAWNRTREGARKAIGAGAHWVSELGTLASEAAIVVTMLTDDAEVERAFFGTNGLLTGHVDGHLFIDLSTVSRRTHDRIAPALSLRNARLVECPVGDLSLILSELRFPPSLPQSA